MPLEADLAALGVLVEPQRRRVYEHLVAQRDPSSLSELGAALDMSRTLLTFHLSKLVEAGFVDVLAPSADGRRGRPSQRYVVTDHEVSATVPARRYDLVAEVLLEAAGEAGPIAQSALRVARRRGTELAAAERSRRVAASASRLRVVQRLLAKLGYAPRREGQHLVLANCPFDRLRKTNLALVCAINHALAEGYLDGLGQAEALTAQLRPCPDTCCVVISPA